jgi:hypothetical protein
MAGEITELELDMNVEPASMLRAVEKRRQATTESPVIIEFSTRFQR